MVRGKGKALVAEQVLGPSEIEGLREQRQELESVLKEKLEYGRGTAADQIDEGAVRREIRKLDQAINSQPKLSDRERDEAFKRLQKIEDAVVIGMPTRYEMDKPTKNPGAVRKHMDWARRNAALMNEHRDPKNQLGEYGRSIEALRKEK